MPVPGSLTVSLVSHGQASLITPLLRQLAEQTAPGLISDVRITLNLPEPVPDDWAQLARLPSTPIRVDIIRNDRPVGFATNHNRALADCHNGLVAVLNPDLRLIGDPLACLAEVAAQPQVGLTAPCVLEPDGRQADAARDLITPASLLGRTLLGRRQPSPSPHWFAGMCLLMPAAAWRSVGGFDERYRLYCEDFDLCARMRLAGWRLVQVPQARVVHAAQRSSHRSLRPLAWHLRSLAQMWCSSAFHDYRRLLKSEARRACAAEAKG